MLQKFCINCGHGAPLDCKFCEECGVSLDEIARHQEPASSALKLSPFSSLYDFVKQHLALINGVVLFSGTVVGVLDFCVPVLKPILVILYWMTGGLSVLMLLAALFPALWMKLISKLGYSNEGGNHTAVPLHKRDAWRGAILLLMGVTAAGVVSLAKANQGGALASSFPSLKTLQESMLSLNQRTDQIQIGVKDANSKLDILVEAVDPSNPADRCTDITCAVVEGASVKALKKLFEKGVRLPPNPINRNVLLADIGQTSRLNRMEVLDILIDNGLDPNAIFIPAVLDPASATHHAGNIAKSVLRIANYNANPILKFTRFPPPTGDATVDAWSDLVQCLSTSSGGIALIELAALRGDKALYEHLIARGLKLPSRELTCKWKVAGGGGASKIIISKGIASAVPG